ncbi:MAG TPA: YdcF family protein [Bradyrhizobium sp.]|nr:YdcF family protein [Bradyrhizobium sp.]
MFFFLSKTLGILLLPVNVLIVAVVVGALLLRTRRAALGRRLLTASVLLLALCGFSPIGKLLIAPLEQRFPPWDPSRGSPDGIVVLGGAIDPDQSAAQGRAAFTRSADRFVAAAMLARQYPKVRIVYAGGNANLISDDSAKEADFALSAFENFGIARERLIAERNSRNTAENAAYAKVAANPKPGERWLLVTSAFHMPRSMGLFRKAGFAVEAYPVDWRLRGRRHLFAVSFSALDGLERTDVAVREWIGLAVYWAVGKIDNLLPGP